MTGAAAILPDADEARASHGDELLTTRHVVDVEVARELVRRGWRQRGHGEGLGFCVACTNATTWMDPSGRPMHHHCTRRHGDVRRPPWRLATPMADRYLASFGQTAPRRPLPPPSGAMDLVERDDVDQDLWRVLQGMGAPSAQVPVFVVQRPDDAHAVAKSPEAAQANAAKVESAVAMARPDAGSTPEAKPRRARRRKADAPAASQPEQGQAQAAGPAPGPTETAPKKPRAPRKKKPAEVSLPPQPAADQPTQAIQEPQQLVADHAPGPTPQDVAPPAPSAPAAPADAPDASFGVAGLDW